MKKITALLSLLTLVLAHALGQSSAGNVQGTITTSDDKPAEGVTIFVRHMDKTVIADNNGAFTIHGLPAGDYTLVVSLVSHQDQEQPVTVESGKTTPVKIKLQLSNRELSEVVVIGNKSSFKTNRTSSSLRLQTPILETPQNIQVITGKLINDQQIFDMLEGVTRNVSGATRVEHWDNYARIYMRGSQVAAFRNGMNVSTTWGPLTEDMSMVERVEFVKGPAGFMLANGNPSGFYNVVTKKPSGRTKGEFDVSLGSFDMYRASLDLDGKLSGDGKLLYRLNVMGQMKGSHREYDYNNRYSVAPVIKYLVDDKSSLTLEYTQQFSQVNVIGSNYIFSKRKYADLPRDFTTGEANFDPTNMTDRSILAIFDHKINDKWKLTAQAAYFNYKQVGASLWPVSFSATNDSLMQRGISIWDVLGLSKMGQVFLNGEATTGKVTHKLLGGIDMSDKTYYHDWNQAANLGDSTFNIYKPTYGNVVMPVWDRSKSIRERGVQYKNAYNAFYAQDELSFMDNRLRLTVAGRYTTLTTSNPYDGSYKRSKFTPRAGLSYSIEKNTAAYFVYDQAFNENYGTDWQGKSFDPETGSNIELGLKRDWLNGKWNSVVSVYRITKNNVLTADLEHSSPARSFSKQTGQQQVQGVELDIRGQIVKNLDVIINYAFTEAKVTKDSDPKVIGNQVAGTTRHVQNAWLNYKVDRGVLSGLGLSIGGQYQVKRAPWYVFDNSENSLPDYFRLDGSLSYQKDKLGFNLVINNILNKYLYSGAFYNWGNYYYWQTEPGTNLRFTVAYKF